jgi:hypothetical protein
LACRCSVVIGFAASDAQLIRLYSLSGGRKGVRNHS